VHFALILNSRFHDLCLADLLHQLGDAALLDELRPDVFSKYGELSNRGRISEKAREKMEALSETSKQVNKCLPLF
jgi:hypothetical protein